MNKYPAHLVEAFLSYSRTLNMVRAAEDLGISQPALSRQLRDFEHIVGQKLFQTQGRNKSHTQLGFEIYQRLEKNWINFSDLIQEVSETFANKPQNIIKIYGPSELISRIARYAKYPHPLEFIPKESEKLEKHLLSNEINLGIGRRLNEDSQLISKFLFKSSFVLITSKKWQLQEKSFSLKTFKKLSEKPRLAYRKDFINAELIKLLEQAGTNYQRIIPHWQVILELTLKGEGWALIPEDVLKFNKDIADELHQIRAPHDIIAPTEYYLFYRKELGRVPWMKSLIDEVTQISVQK